MAFTTGKWQTGYPWMAVAVPDGKPATGVVGYTPFREVPPTLADRAFGCCRSFYRIKPFCNAFRTGICNNLRSSRSIPDRRDWGETMAILRDGKNVS